MANRTAIVGLGHTGTSLVPFRHIGSRTAHLEIHAAGQPVAQPEGIADRHLKVEMGVDEARRHDMAGGIYRLGTLQRFLADFGNAAIFDTDVGDTVKLRFRVHDPAVVDNEIIVLRNDRRRDRDTQHHQTGQQASF